MAECALVKEDFYVFVQQTYDELYRIESRVNGGRSPLAVFCWIDVGITENPVIKKVCSICSILAGAIFLLEVNGLELSGPVGLWASYTGI